MDAALDVFHPLLRVLDRYRHDVHQLSAPSSEEALERAHQALGFEVPPTLQRFLARWNGAHLFRGALRIRAADELAPVSDSVPRVIAFAEGPRPEDRWCFVVEDGGEALFGRWLESEEGGAFEPLHDRFERWLFATIRIIDEDRRDPAEQQELRLGTDPECAHLLLRAAEDQLARGELESARVLLRKATAAEPGLVGGWARLGDSLRGSDAHAARWAYVKALRALRLPAPYPSTEALGAPLIHALEGLFPKGDDGWERELVWFLGEAVTDVSTTREEGLVEAAGMALARVRLVRGERRSAHEALLGLAERSRGFGRREGMATLTLALARLEIDLGLHDEAERRIRPLRQGPHRASWLSMLGRVAVLRQEPWGEEILVEALGISDEGRLGDAERVELLTLLGERRLLSGRPEEALAGFQSACRLAEGLGRPALAAAAWLGVGDVHRHQEQMAEAEEAWRQARTVGAADPELLTRVLLRRGDLYRLSGQPDAACADYQRAVQDFQQQGLPMREAWAWLRLAQLGVEGAADSGRALFKAADLAAGVAAADAISGDPAASLDWHLTRSAEHARDRANAQRVRPPLVRADADRPERRIGAHRSAIAACSAQVVPELAAELELAMRLLDSATPRSTDPTLVRATAAADLLAGHRSYEAAEVMLRLLLAMQAGSPAQRALAAAMARSPNAALVDGLIEALDGGFDPRGMAAAAEVLGWRREMAAAPVLRRLIAPSVHRSLRKAAIVALGRIGDAEAVDPLLGMIEETDLAEEISTALLLLGEWQGVNQQAQALAEQRPGSTRSLGEIVGRYGGPAYLLLLYRTADMEGPSGIGALQGLGYLGDPRCIGRLIDACASRDPVRVQVANGALELITGHSETTEESLLRNRWLEWMEHHGDGLREGQRHRHGAILHPGAMVERLLHDDPMVRRGTYDELVISTGERMPFDADGPYRVQMSHLAEWRRWWRTQGERFPAGRWFFHGGEIG